VTIHTLPRLKSIRLVSVRSNIACINIGVRIELIIINWIQVKNEKSWTKTGDELNSSSQKAIL